MKKWLIVLVCLLIVGCATTGGTRYWGGVKNPIKVNINAPREVVDAVAVKVLEDAGYKVLPGRISTLYGKRIATEEIQLFPRRVKRSWLDKEIKLFKSTPAKPTPIGHLSFHLYMTEKKAKNITFLRFYLMTDDLRDNLPARPANRRVFEIDEIYDKHLESLPYKIKELAEKDLEKPKK